MQERRLHRPRRLPLVAALLVGLGTACSSTSGEPDGEGGTPLRVAYVSYNTGQQLELVSEAHTPRLEQYSEKRADANLKVQSNDVMSGLVDILEGNGFDKYAQEGHCPIDGAGRFAWALEIEGPEGPKHVLAHPGLAPEEIKALQRYMLAFVDTYNATYALQAVDVAPGDQVFKTPSRR